MHQIRHSLSNFMSCGFNKKADCCELNKLWIKCLCNHFLQPILETSLTSFTGKISSTKKKTERKKEKRKKKKKRKGKEKNNEIDPTCPTNDIAPTSPHYHIGSRRKSQAFALYFYIDRGRKVYHPQGITKELNIDNKGLSPNSIHIMHFPGNLLTYCIRTP